MAIRWGFREEDSMLYNILRRVKKLDPKPRKIYCVGGQSQFFKRLISEFEVVCLDIDKSELKIIERFCPLVQCICFNVEEWDFDIIPQESVETLVFARSLHHMQEPQCVIKNAISVIKPTGILLITDFTQEQMGLKLMRQQVSLSSGCGFVEMKTYREMEQDYKHLEKLGLGSRKDLVDFYRRTGLKNFRLYYSEGDYSLFWRKKV